MEDVEDLSDALAASQSGVERWVLSTLVTERGPGLPCRVRD